MKSLPDAVEVEHVSAGEQDAGDRVERLREADHAHVIAILYIIRFSFSLFRFDMKHILGKNRLIRIKR